MGSGASAVSSQSISLTGSHRAPPDHVTQLIITTPETPDEVLNELNLQTFAEPSLSYLQPGSQSQSLTPSNQQHLGASHLPHTSLSKHVLKTIFPNSPLTLTPVDSPDGQSSSLTTVALSYTSQSSTIIYLSLQPQTILEDCSFRLVSDMVTSPVLYPPGKVSYHITLNFDEYKPQVIGYHILECSSSTSSTDFWPNWEEGLFKDNESICCMFDLSYGDVVKSELSSTFLVLNGAIHDLTESKKIYGLGLDSTTAAEPESRTCVICLTEEKSYACRPCMHLCVCEDCAGELIKVANVKCPMCRGDVEGIVKVQL
ncbi:hypothetical protein TrVE_jg2172 [Triparma verrucosa]|uniref:RING-type domain-containing protein n=1 Tax=Triparma verrucosa TaxID=1606542 RepID=A0A9W7KWH1_9STRA|nr:hypothetical protein TrVE_jg2172 [Triparma verrucosa]